MNQLDHRLLLFLKQNDFLENLQICTRPFFTNVEEKFKYSS